MARKKKNDFWDDVEEVEASDDSDLRMIQLQVQQQMKNGQQ